MHIARVQSQVFASTACIIMSHDVLDPRSKRSTTTADAKPYTKRNRLVWIVFEHARNLTLPRPTRVGVITLLDPSLQMNNIITMMQARARTVLLCTNRHIRLFRLQPPGIFLLDNLLYSYLYMYIFYSAFKLHLVFFPPFTRHHS